MMKMKNLLHIAIFVVATTSYSAFAGDYGTAQEAKAMLERVVTALKTDESATLAKINKGEDGFKDRDLYPFCAAPDGSLTAHPVYYPDLDEGNLKTVKDKTGKAFGAEIFQKSRNGEISEVAYMWPRPGETNPVQKIAFVTKVGDQVCGVGYYKE